MDVLTTKTFRSINPAKVRPGMAVRIVKKGETIRNIGTVDRVTNAAVTIGAYPEGKTTKITITLTADQLYNNAYEELLYTTDLENIQKEYDNDWTTDESVEIFDTGSVQKEKYARWTQDGVNYKIGKVTGISETQISVDVLGGKTTLKVADAQNPNFLIALTDELEGGGKIQWLIIEEEYNG